MLGTARGPFQITPWSKSKECLLLQQGRPSNKANRQPPCTPPLWWLRQAMHPRWASQSTKWHQGRAGATGCSARSGAEAPRALCPTLLLPIGVGIRHHHLRGRPLSHLAPERRRPSRWAHSGHFALLACLHRVRRVWPFSAQSWRSVSGHFEARSQQSELEKQTRSRTSRSQEGQVCTCACLGAFANATPVALGHLWLPMRRMASSVAGLRGDSPVRAPQQGLPLHAASRGVQLPKGGRSSTLRSAGEAVSQGE